MLYFSKMENKLSLKMALKLVYVLNGKEIHPTI